MQLPQEGSILAWLVYCEVAMTPHELPKDDLIEIEIGKNQRVRIVGKFALVSATIIAVAAPLSGILKIAFGHILTLFR
jgi:hypothetical protein